MVLSIKGKTVWKSLLTLSGLINEHILVNEPFAYTFVSNKLLLQILFVAGSLKD